MPCAKPQLLIKAPPSQLLIEGPVIFCSYRFCEFSTKETRHLSRHLATSHPDIAPSIIFNNSNASCIFKSNGLADIGPCTVHMAIIAIKLEWDTVYLAEAEQKAEKILKRSERQVSSSYLM